MFIQPTRYFVALRLVTEKSSAMKKSCGGFLLPDGMWPSSGQAMLPAWQEVRGRPWHHQMSHGSLGEWVSGYSGSQKNVCVVGLLEHGTLSSLCILGYN